jgi:tRNA A37 threonylcarbamoyladenosine biosynthesis protein TsaE
MKILVTGSHGSGKTTLAKPLSELLGAIYYNATVQHPLYNKAYIQGVVDAGGIIVIESTVYYKYIKPDFLIVLDTLEHNLNVENWNRKPDYIISEWFDDTHEQLYKLLLYYRKMLPPNEFIATTA